MSSHGQRNGLKRRDVLGGLGATAAVGLAGCPVAEDDPDDDPGADVDDEDLGERVPELGMGFFAPWPIFEHATEAASQHIAEALDHDTNPFPVDHTTHVRNLIADNRESGMLPSYFFSEEVDPFMPTRRTNAEEAGVGGPNSMQWVNCEYSNLIEAQGLFEGEERQQILNEALGIMSEDVAVIPFTPWPEIYAMRTDIMEPHRMGRQGVDGNNPESFVHTQLVGDEDVLRVALATTIWLETTNFWVFSDQGGPWNNLVHSPLYYHGPEWEIKPAIAESTEHEEDGERVIVNIHEDADFDNGDPVTAADVKFTYEYLFDNPGTFPDSPPTPWLEDIEEIDDKTIAFNLTRVHTPLETREFPNWGILHRETWVDAGADEGAEGVYVEPEDMVGSGPFELDLFVDAERLGVTPRDEYHVEDLDPSQHPDGGIDMELVRVADTPTAFEWLRAGDVAMADILGDQADQIEGEDEYEIFVVDPISNAFFAPQCNWGPTQFLEFRQACASAINRAEIAAVATGGWEEPDTHCTILARTHPWRPPDEALYQMPHPDSDDPTGDPERAREFLEEAGWQWDADGNLRYPPDYDPGPLWESESTPDPDDYPCLEDDGEGGTVHSPPDDFDPEDYL